MINVICGANMVGMTNNIVYALALLVSFLKKDAHFTKMPLCTVFVYCFCIFEAEVTFDRSSFWILFKTSLSF